MPTVTITILYKFTVILVPESIEHVRVWVLKKSYELTLYFLSSASSRAIFFSMLSARESTFATQSLMSTELEVPYCRSRTSGQCCGSGSGIQCCWTLDPYGIRDRKNPDPWSEIRIPDHIFESLEKKLEFFVNPVLRIRDPGYSVFWPLYPGWKRRIRVQDKHPGSATLLLVQLNNEWTSGLSSTISIMNTNILQNTNLLNYSSKANYNVEAVKNIF